MILAAVELRPQPQVTERSLERLPEPTRVDRDGLVGVVGRHDVELAEELPPPLGEWLRGQGTVLAREEDVGLRWAWDARSAKPWRSPS